MADDDDDDVAVDGDMEPESVTGEAPGGGGDDDDYDDGDSGADIQPGGSVARVIEAARGTRPISDKTRAALAAGLKKNPIVTKGDEPDDDDMVDETSEAPAGLAAAAPPVVAPAAAVVTPPPVAPPPAPSLDPEIVQLRETLTARTADLDAREKALVLAERSGDMGKLRELYFDRGAPAVVEIIKKWAGNLTEDELKDEIGDLITDLSGSVLGVNLPQEVRDRLESRRTRKGVKVWKADQERAAQELAEKQERAQEEQNRVRVKGILTQEITKPEHAQTFPWLAVEPNSGDIIFDVMEAAHKKDGTRLSWQEAAKRANDYLQNQTLAYVDKRKHLLPTASGQASQANGKQQRTQGDQQVRRSQAPQTTEQQQQATPPPTARTVREPETWNPEAHRKSVKAKFRTAFTRQDDE